MHLGKCSRRQLLTLDRSNSKILEDYCFVLDLMFLDVKVATQAKKRFKIDERKFFFLISFKNSFTSFFFRQNLFPSNLVAAIFFYWRLVGIGNGRKNAEGMVRIIGSSQRDGSWIFNIKNRLRSSKNTYFHTYYSIKEILDYIWLDLYFNINFSQTRLTIVFKDTNGFSRQNRIKMT